MIFTRFPLQKKAWFEPGLSFVTEESLSFRDRLARRINRILLIERSDGLPLITLRL